MSLRNRKQYTSLIRFFTCSYFLIQADSIFASCVVSNPSNPQPFITILSASVLLVTIFTFLSWLIHKIFLSRACIFSWPKVVAIILSIMIGGIGSFGIPQYQTIYSSFGSELPLHISFLFSFNHLLWLPTLMLLVLFSAHKSSSNQLLYIKLLIISEAMLLILVFLVLYSVEILLC